ncbi:MAG: hypothetical protein VB049_11710 [Candidatus Pelethousia sp.]|nr:hypothetical protein [Candidatus Pelethousia sp.]
MPEEIRLTSMGTRLMCKESGASSFTQIKNVRGYPAFMGEPERVDTTCIEDSQKTYGAGQSDPGDMVFTFGFTGMGEGTNWARLRAIQASGSPASFQTLFPDGSGFQWDATLALSMDEVGDGNSPLTFKTTMFPVGEIVPLEEVTAG